MNFKAREFKNKKLPAGPQSSRIYRWLKKNLRVKFKSRLLHPTGYLLCKVSIVAGLSVFFFYKFMKLIVAAFMLLERTVSANKTLSYHQQLAPIKRGYYSQYELLVP